MVLVKKTALVFFGFVAMIAMWSAGLTVIEPLNSLNGLQALICQSTAFVFCGVGFGGFVLSILSAEKIYK